MLKIVEEISLEDFDAWSGGKDTLDRLIELDRVDEIERYIEELYPDGCTDTELNDFLWFEDDTIADLLDMSDLWEDEEDEEEY